MNWQMVEAYLQRDDRCVLPLGCTEQHATLSLATDSILAGRLSEEVAGPLGIPETDAPVIAWDRGSVREVVEPGVTGFIVKTEEEAVAALAKIDTIDRARVRARFEERFTATRMAEDYVTLYRQRIALASGAGA